ncbi:LLM class flavin-dependent oxidoreductase [candidate division KSB1 bacterium]|nr:LLM class flavin-dependent oxidoreductase [candidate division KSB1 bacterium]
MAKKNQDSEDIFKIPEDRELKFYVALRGDKTPREYIRIGKLIEALGFDRIYVYDDLMYRPSWPILNLIARNTEWIELGPCVVNGFYVHPAMIAENAVFLDETSDCRGVLGLGRGAFFDFLNMDNDEYRTRKGCEEAIHLVKRFFKKDSTPFAGDYFNANEKAVLRWEPPRSSIPIVLGSWNDKMAVIAGQFCDELQIAESWNLNLLRELYQKFHSGFTQEKRSITPYFSIGGMSCISLDEKQAYHRAKRTMAVYLPYLKGVMSKSGFDVNTEAVKNIEYHSKLGQYEKAAPFISDYMVKTLSLSGNPTQVVDKLDHLISNVNIRGILFSPPYGTAARIDENLELIVDKVITPIKSKYIQNRDQSTATSAQS